jgi:hypothetical protein
MIRDLRLNGAGDILLPAQWITGTELILQRIAVKLKIFRGEPLFDVTAGTPWMTWLGARKNRPSAAALAVVLQGLILQIEGIASCVCTATESGDTMTVRADVALTDGTRSVFEIEPTATRRGNPGGIWMRLIAG